MFHHYIRQIVVDAYAKNESERLQFLRREQDHLKADNNKDIWETKVNQDGDLRYVGQKVILPATFCGFGLFGFLTSSSTTRLYPGRVPRLTYDNFTCCHTRDRAGRPWLLSQPVTLY